MSRSLGLATLALAVLPGCSAFSHPPGNVRADVTERELDHFNGESIAGVITTSANARSVIFRSHSFAAEPPPDTATSVVAQLAAALKVDNKAATGVGGEASFGQTIASNITRLGKRTQGVTLFRDATFRLAEARANSIERDLAIFGDVDQFLRLIVTELRNCGWFDIERYIPMDGQSPLLAVLEQAMGSLGAKGFPTGFIKAAEQLGRALFGTSTNSGMMSGDIEAVLRSLDSLSGKRISSETIALLDAQVGRSLVEEVSARIGRGLDHQWFDAYHATLNRSVELAIHELNVNPTLGDGNCCEETGIPLPNRFEGSRLADEPAGLLEVSVYWPSRAGGKVKCEFVTLSSKDLYGAPHKRVEFEVEISKDTFVGSTDIQLDRSWFPGGMKAGQLLIGMVTADGVRPYRLDLDWQEFPKTSAGATGEEAEGEPKEEPAVDPKETSTPAKEAAEDQQSRGGREVEVPETGGDQ